jgi:RHH-type proline utilization regulon transcriptional repressor/proline dehydrogenase/delta 1-pyrroline-5-carboxylate dehydrogenase
MVPARGDFAAVLIEPGHADHAGLIAAIAGMAGPIPLLQQADAAGRYRADWLIEEQVIAINTTAAGGNASLMAIA